MFVKLGRSGIFYSGVFSSKRRVLFMSRNGRNNRYEPLGGAPSCKKVPNVSTTLPTSLQRPGVDFF